MKLKKVGIFTKLAYWRILPMDKAKWWRIPKIMEPECMVGRRKCRGVCGNWGVTGT